MLRKLALCAVVALVPGFAFAAVTGTNDSASKDTHVTATETKTDAVVKSDAATTKTDVKSDAAKPKVAGHRAKHKAAAKGKTDSKAGTENSSKS